MSRFIPLVALLQMTLVLAGFFSLAIIMKVDGYPGDPPFFASLSRVVWSPLALFLRHNGLALMFIPAVWTVAALLSQRRRIIFYQDSWLIGGVIIAVGLIVLFIYACARRYTVVPN